mmetsp:Transcript_106720/g.340680  ORF Transcript_106720/g.340680 Transcript_106720/m.340680 type:complete len:352 (+) Transcript_106720:328-1383(+)
MHLTGVSVNELQAQEEIRGVRLQVLAPVHAKRNFVNGRVRKVADEGSSLGVADEQAELQDHSVARAVQLQPQESVAPTPLLTRRPPPGARFLGGRPILARHEVQPHVAASAEAQGRRYQGATAISLQLPEDVVDAPLRSVRLGGARQSGPGKQDRQSCEPRGGRRQARRRPEALREEDAGRHPLRRHEEARRRHQGHNGRWRGAARGVRARREGSAGAAGRHPWRRREEARRLRRRRDGRRRGAARGARAGRERSAGAGCLHTASVDSDGILRGRVLGVLRESALRLAELLPQVRGDQCPELPLGRQRDAVGCSVARGRHRDVEGPADRSPPSVRAREAERHRGSDFNLGR